MSGEDYSAAALAPPPPPTAAGLLGGLGGHHRNPQLQERAQAWKALPWKITCFK